jgi:hypothetical protein
MEPPPPPHEHKFKKVLVEFSLDFGKDSLSQFKGNNGKKMVFVMQQLVVNLKIAGKWATIDPTEDTSDYPALGGQTTRPVPSNRLL